MIILRTFGAIGAMGAPIVVTNIPGAEYLIPLFAIAITQLVLLLPPILNKKLPDSFDEATKLKDDSKSCCTY